jgi:hypothetical protein
MTESRTSSSAATAAVLDVPFCVLNYAISIMSLIWDITGIEIERFKTGELHRSQSADQQRDTAHRADRQRRGSRSTIKFRAPPPGRDDGNISDSG